jgi:molecular chaperone DnaJ
MKDEDLYAVLGVARTASADEIKKAYRKLARKYHPDVNPGNTAAEERFKEISEAHDVLIDPEKRKLYDEFGKAGVQAGFDAEKARGARDRMHEWQEFRGSWGEEPRRPGFGGYSRFEDIFGDIFGEQARPGASIRGSDLESELEIDLLQAVRGMSTAVSVQRAEPCPTCGGAGVDTAEATTCPECKGSGRSGVGKGPVAFTRACPHCGGVGRVGVKPCPSCGGSGAIARQERLNVRIPPGVDTGSRVRVAGKGGLGANGGQPGDLYIVIRVRPHPLLERRGDDLYMDLPVTVGEALAGASIEVPTPEGAVRVRVPAGSQAGRLLRVRRQGVPQLKGDGRGDLYLRLVVRVPDRSDDAILEASRALEGGYTRPPREGLRL